MNFFRRNKIEIKHEVCPLATDVQRACDLFLSDLRGEFIYLLNVCESKDDIEELIDVQFGLFVKAVKSVEGYEDKQFPTVTLRWTQFMNEYRRKFEEKARTFQTAETTNNIRSKVRSLLGF